MTKARHALTKAEYCAEGPNSVRVVDGDKWGRFDRYGGWLEGEIFQCDPQLCIWLTGLVHRANAGHCGRQIERG